EGSIPAPLPIRHKRGKSLVLGPVGASGRGSRPRVGDKGLPFGNLAPTPIGVSPRLVARRAGGGIHLLNRSLNFV
ncbi:MAG: hypothetical protein CMF63_01210, partial [Magnetovibrio sp.]|nr:hypothetical protein [Magnetovibrio sp.]